MSSEPIVVGTDGSQTAERAVERAAELARSLGATLHVVTSFNPKATSVEWATAPGVPVPGLTAAEHERVAGEHERDRTRAEQIVERARHQLVRLGVDAHGHVRVGDPADSLMELAESEGAQMIVVGNKGMTGARRVLGSVPNKISHHARCAVLIVPTS
jgi:nucleotide-binding universal stress UspA family protein